MAIKFDMHPDTHIEGVLVPERQKKVVTVPKPGNRILLGENADITGLKLEIFGTGNTLRIGRNCRLRGHILMKGGGLTVDVGDHTTFVDTYLLCSDGCDISIGRWCMFSRKIEVRVTDAHSLIDAETGRRLNQPGPITIGDHVWVGLGVVINKGVTIGADNVIGAGSFVNRSFVDQQCVIAGAPARIVKRGVTWNRSQKDTFTADEMDFWKAP